MAIKSMGGFISLQFRRNIFRYHLGLIMSKDACLWEGFSDR